MLTANPLKGDGSLLFIENRRARIVPPKVPHSLGQLSSLSPSHEILDPTGLRMGSSREVQTMCGHVGSGPQLRPTFSPPFGPKECLDFRRGR